MLPQLRRLERQYPNELQVVSIHSPKFPTERETANLRQAILRLRIEHPVVNDADFATWQQYGARAWPTLFFVDPKGNVIGAHEGELTAEMAQPLFERWFQEYRAAGALSDAPLALERETGSDSVLSFPGKVEWQEQDGRLFIADTNNDRILVADMDGRVQLVVGDGQTGFVDGPAMHARFNQPQGLALGDGALYVADNENHAIRRIDLGDWTVTTVAGTGEQARVMPQGQPAARTPLTSPWDVAVHEGTLYIAMAGIHQLWSMPLDGPEAPVAPWAGSAAEGIVDGPRAQAELAQPSGLAVGPDGLTFADSESSGVREVSWGADGRVRTFIGKGLFHFGDQDGEIEDAKLQHPLDVAWAGGNLYVADTFNHKIKQVYPRMRSVQTVLGGHGGADGPFVEARLDEPGGICTGPDGTLLVADTNNHRIRQVDFAKREVRTIVITLPGG